MDFVLKTFICQLHCHLVCLPGWLFVDDFDDFNVLGLLWLGPSGWSTMVLDDFDDFNLWLLVDWHLLHEFNDLWCSWHMDWLDNFDDLWWCVDDLQIKEINS